MRYVIRANDDNQGRMCECRMCECGRGEKYEQHDYYGIYAGRMCDQCFKERYKQGPYFDPAYAGESLEEGER